MSTTWYPEGYSYPTMNYCRPDGYSSNSSGSNKLRIGYTADRRVTYPRQVQPSRNDTPDLIDGIDYFKIGDPVRIRRYHKKKDDYSLWIPGKVERPIFATDGNAGTRRSYVVSYIDPISGQAQEKTFAPHLNEISYIPSSQPETSVTIRSKRTIVFAYIPVMRYDGSVSNQKIWTPALVLTPPSKNGVRVRILAGPAVNKEVAGVKSTMPYTPQSALECKRQGYDVEGNGRQLY